MPVYMQKVLKKVAKVINFGTFQLLSLLKNCDVVKKFCQRIWNKRIKLLRKRWTTALNQNYCRPVYTRSTWALRIHWATKFHFFSASESCYILIERAFFHERKYTFGFFWSRPGLKISARYRFEGVPAFFSYNSTSVRVRELLFDVVTTLVVLSHTRNLVVVLVFVCRERIFWIFEKRF